MECSKTTSRFWTRGGLWNTIAFGAAATLLAALCVATLPVHAEAKAASPSVLVLDSALGDGELGSLHWLGNRTKTVAKGKGHKLLSAKKPAWWKAGGGSGKAPATFVLTGTKQSTATDAGDVVWALDEIRASGAEPKTFVVAVGTTGLALREYAEDLASAKQSSRADIVGAAFCGTPHNGYTAAGLYPESKLWARVAKASGLSTEDITPGSSYLKKLNGAALPNVTKSLVISGAVGDLGFGLTDGAGTTPDFPLADTVTGQGELAQVSATLSQAVNLTGAWQPFASSIDYPQREVDAQLAERISAMKCYETSDETLAQVRDFYESWFEKQAPVTHNSNVLLLDLSGSMLEKLASGEDKLSAAKEAARDYLQAVQACAALPQAAPHDVSVFGFNVRTSKIASGYGSSARKGIGQMTASGETDIGRALDKALDALDKAPTCAAEHVLLLSDGASTQGKSEKEMLAGAIAKARKAGIVIDTVGFGNVGESNAKFLEKVSSKTGGKNYRASNTYGLRVNFLEAYYRSLGLNLVSKELKSGSSKPVKLGTADARTTALQIGLVSQGSLPKATLLCDGTPLDENAYSVHEDNGLLSVQCIDPKPGAYTLELAGNRAKAHVFAVQQLGISDVKTVEGEQQDFSLLLLAAAGVILVIALVAVLARGLRRQGGATGTTKSKGGRN